MSHSVRSHQIKSRKIRVKIVAQSRISVVVSISLLQYTAQVKRRLIFPSTQPTTPLVLPVLMLWCLVAPLTSSTIKASLVRKHLRTVPGEHNAIADTQIRMDSQITQYKDKVFSFFLIYLCS